jgi:hypothetical protein
MVRIFLLGGLFLFLGCGKESCKEVLWDLEMKGCGAGEIVELEEECHRLERTYRSDAFESYILCLRKLSCSDIGYFRECRGSSLRGIFSKSYHVDFCWLWCEYMDECRVQDFFACKEDCLDFVKPYKKEVISSARACLKYSCNLSRECVKDIFYLEEWEI